MVFITDYNINLRPVTIFGMKAIITQESGIKYYKTDLETALEHDLGNQSLALGIPRLNAVIHHTQYPYAEREVEGDSGGKVIYQRRFYRDLIRQHLSSPVDKASLPLDVFNEYFNNKGWFYEVFRFENKKDYVELALHQGRSLSENHLSDHIGFFGNFEFHVRLREKLGDYTIPNFKTLIELEDQIRREIVGGFDENNLGRKELINRLVNFYFVDHYFR